MAKIEGRREGVKEDEMIDGTPIDTMAMLYQTAGKLMLQFMESHS